MESLQIDLELEEQDTMQELSDLLTETPTAMTKQAEEIIPTTAATPTSTAPTPITDQEIDFKQFLTKKEGIVLRDLGLAMKTIGVPLTLGNGIIHDFIQISNLKDIHRQMILEVLMKNRELGYIQDLYSYFRPAGRQTMKRKFEVDKLEKLPSSIETLKMKFNFKGYIRSQTPVSSMSLYASNQVPNGAMLLATPENAIVLKNVKFMVGYIENGMVGINATKNADRDATCLITPLKEHSALLRWDSVNSHPRLGGEVSLIWDETKEPTLKRKFQLTCIKVMAI